MSLNVEKYYEDYVSHVDDESFSQQCKLSDRQVWNSPTNAVYAVLYENEEFWRVPYFICYGHLNDDRHARRNGFYDTPHTIFVQIQTPIALHKGNDEGMMLTYYEWLFNHSPYRSAFITKDYRKAMTDRVVMLDAKAESSLLVGACSAVRLPWESYYKEYNLSSIVRMWWELVSKGDDPNIAMALANNVNIVGSNVTVRKETVGHQFIQVNSNTSILNFSSDKHLETVSYADSKEVDGYVGITGVWRDLSHKKANKLSSDVFSWISGGLEGDVGKKVNPFSRYDAKEYKLSKAIGGLSELCSEVVSILHPSKELVSV